MIQMFNFLYFLMIASLIAGSAILFALSRRMSSRGAHVFCMAFVWANFALHFLKMLNPYYLADFPYSLTNSSLENLCAVTIVVSPFVYTWGPKWLKAYVAAISILSGFLVYVWPTSLIGLDLSNVGNLLEMFRFYLCHFPLVAIPLILLDKKFVVIEVKDCWTLPFLFMLHMGIVTLNEVGLKLCGITNATWLDILSRDYRNGAWSNGLASNMDGALGFLYWLLPHFYIDGVLYFVPAIWPIVPLILFAPWIGIGIAAIFDHRAVKASFRGIKAKMAVHRLERRAHRAGG